MRKTFIVTGCNGYIGSHMCYELKKAYPDCIIHGVDKVEKRHLRHLYNTFNNVDLAVDSFVLPPADCVFHFAAYISVEESMREPLMYYRNNLVGSVRLIEQSIKAKIPNFVFSSTAAVYGNVTGYYIKECSLMNAFSVYGKTKQMVEEILSYVTDMNVIRLRYFNACGRNVEAGLYEEHDPETHLIPLLVKNKTATIYGSDWPTPDGTCVRDYIHVIDICSAHLNAFEYMDNQKRHINEFYNVGLGKGYSVLEVVDEVNKIIHNGEMKIEYADRRPGDISHIVADSSLIRHVLNFKPKYTLEEIVLSMKE